MLYEQAANQIEGGSGSEMVQVGFREPNVVGTTHAHGANLLRDRPFNPGTLGIELGKCLGFFLLSPLLQGLVLLLGTNGDGASGIAYGVRTQGARWAALTIGGRELDLDDLVGAVVNGRSPTAAFVSFQTCCLLLFPIDEKVVGIEAGRDQAPRDY